MARRQAIQTDRYLAATARNDTWVPPLPYIGAEGPRASGARIVFTRDSMDWAMAQTLGDLVALVPGSYLWRTGWLGTAALPNYHARGATSVEYFLDGLPYVAVGTGQHLRRSVHLRAEPARTGGDRAVARLAPRLSVFTPL